MFSTYFIIVVVMIIDYIAIKHV